ncbi:MAG: rod shape-determining protein MreC [Oscillospiraceae bacterium]
MAILAILLGFMIAGIYSGGSASFLSSAVSAITRPFQQLSSGISDAVSDFFQQRVNVDAVYEENIRLREENAELRGQLTDYNTVKYENEQFREMIGAVGERDDLTILPAAVISRDSANRFYSFGIDKGTVHGVSYRDPVMTADGLVGYVSEVGATYAKVVTILDVQVVAGSYNSTTRDIGVVSGDVQLAEEGLCHMEFLPRDSETKAGDMILTSGAVDSAGSGALGSSLFPRDLYIGTVLRVEPDAHGTDLIAVIRPGADIANVNNVVVITSFEGQAETATESEADSSADE